MICLCAFCCFCRTPALEITLFVFGKRSSKPYKNHRIDDPPLSVKPILLLRPFCGHRRKTSICDRIIATPLNAGKKQGVYLRAASQPRSRHGHAVQGIRQRRPSRKRPHGIQNTHASVSRPHPAARRKARSAEGARVCQRTRRQSTAHLAGDFGNVSDKVMIIDNDVVQYKQVIGTVHLNVEL